MHKLSLSLLMAGLAATTSPGHADNRLDGLDQTMQVLDDVSALERALAVLPSTDELKLPSADSDASDDSLSQGIAGRKLGARSGFTEDIVIEEDDLPFEDDFEEGEDIDDDRYEET